MSSLLRSCVILVYGRKMVVNENLCTKKSYDTVLDLRFDHSLVISFTRKTKKKFHIL